MSRSRFSWGGIPHGNCEVRDLISPLEVLPLEGARQPVLAHGRGRSYGDVCLNDGGTLLETRRLNRFIAADWEQGILTAESGISLAEILDVIVPRGWFLPVTPGTSAVTLGGAVANDVHGKNHHGAGSFGCHVLGLEVLRSEGRRLTCSSGENPGLFEATIGGLGLTGLITQVTVRLKRIQSAWIDTELLPFDSPGECLRMAAESDRDWEYTVAWMDTVSGSPDFGRGLFIRGNHAPERAGEGLRVPRPLCGAVPWMPPFSLIQKSGVRIFNQIYRKKGVRSARRKQSPYPDFFYPLDRISDWNRLYGPKGFYQYQCVIPGPERNARFEDLLRRVQQSETGSYLAIIKTFGERRSPGMLAFARPGIAVALDFPNQGKRTAQLFVDLDEKVRAWQGAVNPSKDARMGPETFRVSFPRLKEFLAYRDSQFSSNLWRRVQGDS